MIHLNNRMTCGLILLATLGIGNRPVYSQDDSTRSSAASLQAQASVALRAGRVEDALRAADALIEQHREAPTSQLAAADVYLRCGKPEQAVKWFDRYLESVPQAMPHLWQRGIAQYFAGDYRGGATQFEEHRKVNPHDVENAAWHFLCVAKADSFETARRLVLPAPNDPRIPMAEVLTMLSNGDTESVRRRMEAVPASTEQRERADFYGYFYLGLYADAGGHPADALRLLRKSASNAPHHYMGDVARVYVQYLEKQVGESKPQVETE